MIGLKVVISSIWVFLSDIRREEKIYYERGGKIVSAIHINEVKAIYLQIGTINFLGPLMSLLLFASLNGITFIFDMTASLKTLQKKKTKKTR